MDFMAAMFFSLYCFLCTYTTDPLRTAPSAANADIPCSTLCSGAFVFSTALFQVNGLATQYLQFVYYQQCGCSFAVVTAHDSLPEEAVL